MNKKLIIPAILLGFLFIIVVSVGIFAMANDKLQDSKSPLISYADYQKLVDEVEKHRSQRLVSLDEFLKKSQKENVVILDTRSKDRFEARHIKGAINLPFTDFTQANLDNLLKDKNVEILIYCNNNFEGDDINFASKMSMPTFREDGEPITLALNIPTYINLYGYGYKNVYELSELINVNDPRLEFEGNAL